MIHGIFQCQGFRGHIIFLEYSNVSFQEDSHEKIPEDSMKYYWKITLEDKNISYILTGKFQQRFMEY